MKDVLKAILFFVGIYIIGVLFFTVIVYLFPFVLGILVVWLIIKLIKNISNG